MASFGAKYIKFAGLKGEPAGKLPIYEAAVELGKLVGRADREYRNRRAVCEQHAGGEE